MNSVAFKMLIGNRAAFIGVIFGVFLAILLISQQSAIFLGLVSRAYRMVTEISLPDIWVIDPATQGEDLIRPMPASYLGYVKGIPGVEWAVPVNYTQASLSTPHGVYKVAEMYGIDDATLLGAPKMLAGRLEDLRRDGGVIIDSRTAQDSGLAGFFSNGAAKSLKIGDQVEINGRQAVIVGIGQTTPGFYPQPILFVTRSQFQKYIGSDQIQYIALKSNKNANVPQLLQQINTHPNMLALTRDQLASRMANHFLKTGILVNFGLSVLLGLIIGLSITGQIFYLMTMNNMKYYALIKALGGTGKMVFLMILSQALIVATIGYILGIGATLLWGYAIKHTTLAFEFPWQMLFFTGLLALIICIFSVVLSVRKVFKLDPHMLMNV